jgi:heme-degrading monooxygenase HmoA
MPFITTDEPVLTVVNLFSTDSQHKQDFLLGEMRQIVDAAAFPGWLSSTVHSGVAWPGTANFIQWRSGEDLEARYAGDVFRHRTIPTFEEKTRWMKLLRTEVVFTQRHPSLGEVTEISPQRDDYTVIEFLAVRPGKLDEVVNTLGPAQEWLTNVPGYRSHSVLRGLGSLNYDGEFALMYSQWASKEQHDAFLGLPESEQRPIRRSAKAQLGSLITSSNWNSYRVVHTRSASLEKSS